MSHIKVNNKKTADIVIILGGGIELSGELGKNTKERLELFLRAGRGSVSAPILLSGRWSGSLKNKPQITEAEAMKKYLVEHGVGS